MNSSSASLRLIAIWHTLADYSVLMHLNQIANPELFLIPFLLCYNQFIIHNYSSKFIFRSISFPDNLKVGAKLMRYTNVSSSSPAASSFNLHTCSFAIEIQSQLILPIAEKNPLLFYLMQLLALKAIANINPETIA